MSKVIYTICSYDDEHSDIVNGCINSSLVTIKRYADRTLCLLWISPLYAHLQILNLR